MKQTITTIAFLFLSLFLVAQGNKVIYNEKGIIYKYEYHSIGTMKNEVTGTEFTKYELLSTLQNLNSYHVIVDYEDITYELEPANEYVNKVKSDVDFMWSNSMGIVKLQHLFKGQLTSYDNKPIDGSGLGNAELRNSIKPLFTSKAKAIFICPKGLEPSINWGAFNFYPARDAKGKKPVENESILNTSSSSQKNKINKDGSILISSLQLPLIDAAQKYTEFIESLGYKLKKAFHDCEGISAGCIEFDKCDVQMGETSLPKKAAMALINFETFDEMEAFRKKCILPKETEETNEPCCPYFAFGSMDDLVKYESKTNVEHSNSNKTIDFGVVTEWPLATLTFKTNGMITSAAANCGCLIPQWSKSGSDELTISYKTAGRIGNFSKTVTVYYKDGTNEVYIIKGTVISNSN